MANTTTTLTAVANFSSLQNGFKQLNEGMSKGREGMQKFGNALGQVSSELGSVGKAFGALGGALASGTIIGAVMAFSSLILDTFKDVQAKAKEAAAAVAEHWKEAFEFRDKALKVTTTQKLERELQAATTAVDKLKEAQDRFNEVKDPRGGVKKGVSREEFEAAALALTEAKAVYDAVARTLKTENLEDALPALRQKVEWSRADDNRESGEEANKAAGEAAKKARAEALMLERQTAAERTAVNEQLLAAKKALVAANYDEYFKGEIEQAQKSGDFSKRWALERAQEEIRIEAWAAEEKRKIRLKTLLKPEEIAVAEGEIDTIAAGKKGLAETRSQRGFTDDFSKAMASNVETAAERQARLTKEINNSAAAAARLGSVMGATLAGVATGQMSVIQGMISMINLIFQTIAAKKIEAIVSQALASIEAAKSAAMTPIFGPILAITAAAAVFGALSSYVGKVGSAAGGWDLPSGGPFPAVLHAKEMVLPAEHAETIRNLGAGAGGTTVVQISAVDAKSVERLFMDNQGAMLRSMNTAFANRRFA